MANVNYTEESIKSLSPLEHIRTRPGMYIGRLGDGSHIDDGIYILLKEIIDKLNTNDREVILLRFYKEKTQMQVAKILGISQVQVSRIEKKVLEKMRKQLA